MKTDQTARAVQSCGTENAMKTDQTAWIMQSCRTEMLWRLIRLRGSCNLVGLKCYEDWSDCAGRAILWDWNAMKTDQTEWIVQSCRTEMLWRLIRLRGSCNLVGLKCYEDWSDCAGPAILWDWNAMKTDQTAWIVQSCRTEMLWRLIRLRGSCNLVGLKCYEDWSDCAGRAILWDWNAMKTDQTAWIVQSCRAEMLWRLIRLHGSCNLVGLKCYEDWSDCVDRAILYDWNVKKTDQTARIVQSCRTEMLWRLIRLRGSCSLLWLKCYEDWSDCMDRAILYDWNAMKTDQTARIVQSCRTEMLWRLIRLRGLCNLVWLKCYEDWSDCMDRAILYDWNAMKTDQIAWIVQSCRTKILWRLIRLRGLCNLVGLKCYEVWSDCVDRVILYRNEMLSSVYLFSFFFFATVT